MHTERSLRGDSRRQGGHGSEFQAVKKKNQPYGAIMNKHVPPLIRSDLLACLTPTGNALVLDENKS